MWKDGEGGMSVLAEYVEVEMCRQLEFMDYQCALCVHETESKKYIFIFMSNSPDTAGRS